MRATYTLECTIEFLKLKGCRIAVESPQNGKPMHDARCVMYDRL